MKKLLLGLGAMTSVVAPVAAVISCGSDEDVNSLVPGKAQINASAKTIKVDFYDVSKNLYELTKNLDHKIPAEEAQIDAIHKEFIDAGSVYIANAIAFVNSLVDKTTGKTEEITVYEHTYMDLTNVEVFNKYIVQFGNVTNLVDFTNQMRSGTKITIDKDEWDKA